MCDCCDKIFREYEQIFYATDEYGIGNNVCLPCARKYKWTYLEDTLTGEVLIDSCYPIYWES